MTTDQISKDIAEELARIRFPSEENTKSIQQKIHLDSKKNKKANKQLFGYSVEEIFELSTARNKQLILVEEQKKLRKTTVAFFGMSVGSHAALTWMMLSRANVIKISDPDIISGSNLNRLRFGWSSIGLYKVDVVESQLKDINPFAQIETLKKTDKESVESFLSNKNKAHIIIDEIDNLEDKIFLRIYAKHNKIPVISATDVGDTILVDVERFDKNQSYPFFHNRIPGVENINFKKITQKEKIKMILQLVGYKKNSARMLKSILNIGKTIPTWPQLGSTATIAGGVITTVLKNIIIEKNIQSGRYYISLDDIFLNPTFEEKNMVRKLINKLP